MVFFLIVCAIFVAIPIAIVLMVRMLSGAPPAKSTTETLPSADIESVAASFAARSFYPSEISQMARTRRNLRITFVIVIITGAFLYWGSWSVMAWMTAVLLTILAFIERMAGRRMRMDQPAVSLTRSGIESPNLSGQSKILLWPDIAGVSYQPVQGNPNLKFELRESAALPNKRSFWTGANLAQPNLLISPLSPQDQEALLGEIQARLASFTAGKQFTLASPTNEIREEREFSEQLKAFAPNTWMTYALIAINIAVWLWTLTAGASLLTTPADKLLHWGGNAASEVQRGEWWRLFSAMFLHSGMMHVLMNMLGLYSAGVIVERVYGRSLYLLIYVASGLLGSAASLHFSAQHAVSVGASGAVFGVTGALLVGFMQHRDKLPRVSSKQMISGVTFFIVYALIQGFGKQGIDNAAHIGGLLGGCLLACILPERFDLDHYRRTVATRFATGLALAIAMTTTVAYEAPKASLDMSRLFASADLLKRGLDRFGKGIKELQQLQDDVKAGKISEWDADGRGRLDFAPKFQSVVDDLRQVVLPPNDPRKDFVQNMLRFSELMTESLAMESIRQEGDGKPIPTNPERMTQIEAEINKVGDQLKANVEQLNKKK
jgi:rhomboid protease GluP